MRLKYLASRNLKEIYRDPITILLGLAMPLLLLFLFSSLQKNVQIDEFSPQSLTPGLIVFSFSFVIMFSGILLAKDKDSAFLARLLTTPLKPTDYILSYLIPFIPFTLIQIILCLIIGSLLGATFTGLFTAIGIFLLIGINCISLGVLLGSLLTVNQVSGAGSLLITAISLFSGAWMNLKAVGGIFEKIGYALPYAHAIDAAKAVLKGETLSTVKSSILFVIISTLIVLVLAVFAFSRKMKKI